jgi:hypothetical protein
LKCPQTPKFLKNVDFLERKISKRTEPITKSFARSGPRYFQRAVRFETYTKAFVEH